MMHARIYTRRLRRPFGLFQSAAFSTREYEMTTVKSAQGVARRSPWVSCLFALTVAVACLPALAGVGHDHGDKHHGASRPAKGNVLPASARPMGYSLYDMAQATAAFNVGNRLGAPPNTPFKILYSNEVNNNSFTVGQGQMLYVPVLYNDDSVPIIGNYPANAENRRALLRYWYSQKEFGIVATDITINGKTTALGGSYLSGVSFSTALPDGAKQYATTAAFITPLPPGVHTIEISAKATGDALREPPFPDYFPDGFFEFRLTYTVTVY
jgi:hypothetical protein